jgi:hypothetical protein
MKRERLLPIAFRLCLVLALATLFFQACSNDDTGTLVPYAGGQNLSTIAIEKLSFTPRVSWQGGYVTVFGVNRGARAALDTSLVWLVYGAGNGVRYPVTFGNLPAGAADLTTQYGGTPIARLKEDNQYTFWVMNDNAWGQVSSQRNKKLVVDSVTTNLVRVQGDTIYVNETSHAQYSELLDVYINIKDVIQFGKLGKIGITKSDTSNSPLITFQVTQAGADSAVSAMGIVYGGIYNVNAVVWEMISKDVQPDTTIFWKNDVIRSPLMAGQRVAGTETFVELAPDGLKRGLSYYLWMANKNWDQQTRLRSTPNYAFTTFTVW